MQARLTIAMLTEMLDSLPDPKKIPAQEIWLSEYMYAVRRLFDLLLTLPDDIEKLQLQQCFVDHPKILGHVHVLYSAVNVVPVVIIQTEDFPSHTLKINFIHASARMVKAILHHGTTLEVSMGTLEEVAKEPLAYWNKNWRLHNNRPGSAKLQNLVPIFDNFFLTNNFTIESLYGVMKIVKMKDGEHFSGTFSYARLTLLTLCQLRLNQLREQLLLKKESSFVLHNQLQILINSSIKFHIYNMPCLGARDNTDEVIEKLKENGLFSADPPSLGFTSYIRPEKLQSKNEKFEPFYCDLFQLLNDANTWLSLSKKLENEFARLLNVALPEDIDKIFKHCTGYLTFQYANGALAKLTVPFFSDYQPTSTSLHLLPRFFQRYFLQYGFMPYLIQNLGYIESDDFLKMGRSGFLFADCILRGFGAHGKYAHLFAFAVICEAIKAGILTLPKDETPLTVIQQIFAEKLTEGDSLFAMYFDLIASNFQSPQYLSSWIMTQQHELPTLSRVFSYKYWDSIQELLKRLPTNQASMIDAIMTELADAGFAPLYLDEHQKFFQAKCKFPNQLHQVIFSPDNKISLIPCDFLETPQKMKMKSDLDQLYGFSYLKRNPPALSLPEPEKEILLSSMDLIEKLLVAAREGHTHLLDYLILDDLNELALHQPVMNDSTIQTYFMPVLMHAVTHRQDKIVEYLKALIEKCKCAGSKSWIDEKGVSVLDRQSFSVGLFSPHRQCIVSHHTEVKIEPLTF